MASLADAIDDIFGGEPEGLGVDVWLDTGYPPLNEAVSGSADGGLPCGRIVQMYGDMSSGKTAIAVEVMKATQQQGGLALFMDHERTFMRDLAEQAGLDMTKGYFSLQYPKSFEESISKAIRWAHYIRENKLIKDDAPLVAVFDSLAAMVPQQKLEKDADQIKMNDKLALAACCSSVFPSLVIHAEETNCLMLFLDQIRQDPSVTFGDCFDYHARVLLENGETELLGKIVVNRMPVNVMSYNAETGTIEPKRVTNWSRQPMDEDWLGLMFRGGRNGRRGFKCTPEHKIFTPDGEVMAKDLKIGDEVLSHGVRYYTEEQHEIWFGGLLGDSSLRYEKSPRGHMRMAHGVKQEAYMRWKADQLGMTVKSYIGSNGTDVFWADSHCAEEFDRYFDIGKQKGLTDLPEHHIANITPRATAIWYCDDGTYTPVKKYGAGSCYLVAKLLSREVKEKVAKQFEAIGLGRPEITKIGWAWYGEESRKFQEGIRAYVPTCMAYKLSKWYEPLGQGVKKMKPKEVLHTSKVIDIYRKTPPRDNRYRFDIEVEDNHNYFVSGVLVHNSTKTSGGKSPGFYSSVRIALNRKVIKKDGVELGQEITAKVVKNKVSRPFLSCTWDFLFRDDGTGYLDRVGGMIDYLCKRGILTKSGAYIKWGEKNYNRKPLIKLIEERGLYDELVKLVPTDPDLK